MLVQASFSAWRQIVSPAFRAILWRSLLLTLGLLALIWAGLKWALAAFLASNAVTAQHPTIDAYALFLSGIGFFLLFIYLLPAVTALVAGFFIDDAAAIVEATDFPLDPPGTPASLAVSLACGLRFAGLSLLVNLAALLLWFLPGPNLIVFFVANAYLLGREYFELAAGRFMPTAAARHLRKANRTVVFAAGAIMALLLMIPVINLVTPLFGVALMVHVHKRRGAVHP